MQLTDYYTVLELAPNASMMDIKRAYRRLAQIYHPDKNGEDPYALAQFALIKEAYETLTNPTRKEQYLQQRWYAKSMGAKTSAEALTPVIILKRMIELDRYTSRLDAHRLDKQSLYDNLSAELSEDNLQVLARFREEEVNRQILSLALSISKPLPSHLFSQLTDRLHKISPGTSHNQQIDRLIKQRRKAEQWELKRPVFLFLFVVLLCVLIYLIS